MKNNVVVAYILCGLAACMFSGCVATTQEYVDLRDEIYQLQVKLGEVQKNQADFSAKMDTLMSSMDALNAELEETQNGMSLLGQRLDDIESNITRKVNKLSSSDSAPAASSPSPSKIYQLAYSDFARGKYDLAIVGFRSYLDEYPHGELADQAQYYLAECYFAEQDWENALDEFESLEKLYPHSKLCPAARLKQALSYEQMGDVKKTRKLLEKLLQDFPQSPEANTAEEKLEKIGAHAQ